MDTPITPSVWRAASVEDQPSTTLVSWRVYEVKLASETVRTRHFMGCAVEARGEGRASAAVVSFDAKTGRGITRSARVYQLKGRPGANLDAEYTWNHWRSINNATDIVDVTKEVAKAIQEAAS